MRIVTDNPFTNISVFGSSARGEQDSFSDFDVIAIVKDGKGKQEDSIVRKAVLAYSDKPPSISWYGENKVRNFFELGDLFAWHLYLESAPAVGYRHLSHEYGLPNKYKNALSDISSLNSIYSRIPNALNKAPQNLKFELGVCYVCLRNIAMSASWHLSSRIDFSRVSPYTIIDPVFPVDRSIYDILWMCRLSGQRGMPPPNAEAVDFKEIFAQGRQWIDRIQEAVKDVKAQIK